VGSSLFLTPQRCCGCAAPAGGRCTIGRGPSTGGSRKWRAQNLSGPRIM